MEHKGLPAFRRRLLARLVSLSPYLLILLGLMSLRGLNKQDNLTYAQRGPFFAPTAASSQPYLVVRAYFTDRQLVADLAAWKEPWQVDYGAGYLVIDVTQIEYARLQAMGFRLEIDEAQTAEYNRPRPMASQQGGGIPGYPCYRTVEETFATAEAIVTAHPDLATWTDAGDSWEKTQDAGQGYDMLVLRLTNSAVAGPKPKLFVMAAVHAREYTTAELNTRFAEYLINNYDLDADVTWLLDYHEVHLLLQSNPDGRKHAETGELWRKNTDNNFCSNTDSRGIDLNRNFQFQWGCCGGSSGAQCSDTFRGPSPASEPETQAIQNYVFAEFPDQRDAPLNAAAPATATGVFLDVHSSGELVLWPWGFTNTVAPNAIALQTLGRKFAYFNDYFPEQAIGLYPTGGPTDDFAYGELGLAAFTFELGTSFFQNCGTFENTIVPDNLPALIYAAKTARTPYLTPAGPDTASISLDNATVEPGVPVLVKAQIDDTHYSNNNGAEPSQPVAAAEIYIDIPAWVTTTVPAPIAMIASDGVFDSSSEAVEVMLDTTGLSAGRHTLFLRGQDVLGNWGVYSATFLTIVGQAPEAGFSSSSPDPLGSTTMFTNTSTGGDLSFQWDFGDGSPLSSEFQPAHLYTAVANYTATLTATNGIGSDVVTGLVVITPPSDSASLLRLKSAAVQTAMAGEVFTYTLSQQVALSGTHSYTQTMVDVIPAEVEILTETIQLNGVARPELYNAAAGAIELSQAGLFTDSLELLLTFQVQVAPDVISGTLVSNTLSGQAYVDGLVAADPGPVTVIVIIYAPAPLVWRYLPWLVLSHKASE